MSDDEILASIRASDQQGIKAIYKQCRTMVYDLILKNGGSREDAEDIFQEAVITFISKVRSAHFVLTCKISSFIYSVARNMWLYKRRQSGIAKIVDTEPLENQAQIDEIPTLEIFEAKHDLIANQFEKIGADCQKLLKAFYFEEKLLKDIAQEMVLTEGFIRIKKMRCLDSLRNLVENHTDFKKYFS